MLQRIAQKIFPWLFGAIGGAAMCLGLWLVVWGALSTTWPSTPGRILSSSLTRNSSDVPTTYGATAVYEYVVASRAYVAKRISFGDYSSSDADHARRLLSRYPAGKNVPVFYNPTKPSMSVLEQGIGWGAYVAFGVGAAFAAFAAFMRYAERQRQAIGISADGIEGSPSFRLQMTGAQQDPGKRITVSRDAQRVLTNYPPYAIVLGAFFLIGGLVLAYFGRTHADGPSLSFVGLFAAAAGGSLAWHSLRGLRLRRIRRQAAGRTPWQYDHPWDRRGASDGDAKSAHRMLFAVVMIAAFLAPMHVLMLKHAQMPGHRIFLYAVFGLFDIILFAGFGRAVYLYVQRYKFGNNQLVFHSFPFFTGQDIRVSFVADKGLRNQAMSAELQCIREYYESSRSGDTANLVFELLFSQRGEFTTDGGGKADLTLQVPADALSTDFTGSPPCYWELVLTAKVDGMDYRGIFLLPIYRAEQGGQENDGMRESSRVEK